MWRRKTEPPQRACILTGVGPSLIDEEYRLLGVKEGWLIWDGFTHDKWGNILNIYRLRSPP